MTVTNPLEVRRCHAHNRQGGQCGLSSVPGGRVCRMHGGLAPQVQLSALERLKRLQPKAIAAVEDVLDQGNPFARLAAAKDVLDRTGVGKDPAVSATVTFTLRIDRGDSDD
jgi:hypothetical protein